MKDQVNKKQIDLDQMSNWKGDSKIKVTKIKNGGL